MRYFACQPTGGMTKSSGTLRTLGCKGRRNWLARSQRIHLEESQLRSAVFADAEERYGGVTITFPTKGLPKGVGANEQRDPFTKFELDNLLGSELPGHLKWLTWLGLYTGARLNELAQLSTKHVGDKAGIHKIGDHETLLTLLKMVSAPKGYHAM